MEELYRAHADVVLAFLIGLTRDRIQAEDLMQETFVRATRAMGGYRGGSPRAWLLAIARTTFLDAVRKRVPVPSDALPDPGVHDPDTVEVLTVRAALDRLPQAQREVLVLRDQLELSYEEIAQTLGRGVGATRVQVHRARAAFRLAYAQENDRG